MSDKGAGNGTKTLIIGIDGGTWALLDHYVAAGHMPAMRQIMEAGVRGPLQSTIPPLTSAAWTSFSRS